MYNTRKSTEYLDLADLDTQSSDEADEAEVDSLFGSELEDDDLDPDSDHYSSATDSSASASSSSTSGAGASRPVELGLMGAALVLGAVLA